ncbi:MAG: hypothetical protein D6806_08340, partial [Deltaproteobacteria bacterium]
MRGDETKKVAGAAAGRKPAGAARALWLCATVWLKNYLRLRTLAWLLPVLLLPAGLAAWQVAVGQETSERLFRQLYVNLYVQFLALGLPLFLSLSAVRDELDDGTAAYTGIFGLAGMVLPRPLVLSIIFALGWEVVCSNLPGGIPRFTLMYYLKSLLGLRPEAGGVLGVVLPPMDPAGAAEAVAVPLAVTAIAVACCALVGA